MAADVIDVFWTADLDTVAAAANQKSPRKVTLSQWKGEGFMHCPSLRDHCKNVYSIDARVNLELKQNPFNEDKDFYLPIESNDLDSYRPDQYDSPEESKRRCYSIQHLIYLATDCKDLEIEILHPFLSNSSFADSCEVIPGGFNLGKYSRSIALSFQVRDINTSEFSIKEGDALYYIRFKTDKRINFIPFYPEKDIMDIFNNMNNSSVLHTNTLKKHYDNYKRFNTKNVLINKIRAQLNES